MTHTPSDNKPLVSVILPTYNGAKWLAGAITSVINQTLQNWELIIVNDCSKDDTPKIADEFARQDARIRVIHNQVNKKLPATLNVGFAEARGEFLTWTSDDNLYKPQALEVMSNYLQAHPETDCTVMNMDFINDDGELVNECGMRIDSNVKADEHKLWGYPRCVEVLPVSCNFGAAFMYRKTLADTVGPYDESLFCVEDYEFWFRVALAGKVDFCPENVYFYRINSQSLTATKQDLIAERTMQVRRKYLQPMMEKYQYNLHDRLFLQAHLEKTTIKKMAPFARRMIRLQRSALKRLRALAPCKSWKAAINRKLNSDIFPEETLF